MRRRDFIGLLGGAAAAASPLATRARAQDRIARIGYLSPLSPQPDPDEFRAGFRDLGYVEGKNLQIVARTR